jgi:hypothetical protein
MNLLLSAIAIFGMMYPNASRAEYKEPVAIVESVDVESEESTNAVVIESGLMQDPNQCIVIDGIFYCVDICGGRSELGTICSYE